jgi:hypothetical protein
MAGFDFSNFGNGVDLFSTGSGAGLATARNCKLPSGWTGTGDIQVGVPSGGAEYKLLNYGVGNTNYKFWTSDGYGTCKDNITVYKTDGAADEAQQHYSIEMVSTASVSWPGHALKSPPIDVRVPAGTKGFYVSFANNTAELTNIEIWAEVEYLGTSDYPLSVFANDTLPITDAGNAAAQTVIGGGWTGSPTYSQMLVVPALTVAETGYARIHVYLARPSTTVYVDWKVTVADE